MRKLLLTLAGGLMISTAAFAQTHSALSCNKPSSGLNGYVFDFGGTSANNCFAGGGVAYDLMPANQTWSIPGDDSLQIVVPTMTVYDDTRQRLHFYTGDCVASPIDLSSAADKKLKIVLKSPMAGQMVVVIYSGAQTNYSAPGLDVVNLVAGTNTYDVSTLDLTGITNQANITDIGLFFRGTTGWGDFNFAGTVQIDYIRIGSGVTPCSLPSGTQSQEVSSSVSVYPNPAKDQFVVNLNDVAIEGTAVVKLVSATGVTVYENTTATSETTIPVANLNKGIYMLQITTGNKVANKKVVVE
jgi:hypothetical protein